MSNINVLLKITLSLGFIRTMRKIGNQESFNKNTLKYTFTKYFEERKNSYFVIGVLPKSNKARNREDTYPMRENERKGVSQGLNNSSFEFQINKKVLLKTLTISLMNVLKQP